MTNICFHLQRVWRRFHDESFMLMCYELKKIKSCLALPYLGVMTYNDLLVLSWSVPPCLLYWLWIESARAEHFQLSVGWEEGFAVAPTVWQWSNILLGLQLGPNFCWNCLCSSLWVLVLLSFCGLLKSFVCCLSDYDMASACWLGLCLSVYLENRPKWLVGC